jgi:sucrose-phosphate synthase
MSENGLYIQMFSLHGLVRGSNLELGRDADTGGQVKYVIELGRALAELEGVRQVDLFTRFLADNALSEDYARRVEQVADRFRIVRIQCGGRKYMRKELLWRHLDEFVDKTIKFIKNEKTLPDIVHGHYPDAGYAAMQLTRIFGVPFIFTGHSLGRAKKQKLLAEGLKEDEIVRKYRIDQRIRVEEEILKYADLIVTSTHQEVQEQYGMYHNGGLADFRVLPPGIDIEKFYPYYHDLLPESERSETALYAQAKLLQELNRFFLRPEKPLILALCRPDKRKNIHGLIRAYGEAPDLQAMANLAVFAGIRRDISQMEENERDVLTQMLLEMDKYDLYGKMAIPKRHDFEHEVPELYRIAAAKRGVFVNPALTEPFGLTLLEASATGLPVVATNDGGPKDIIKNCGSGILVDPTDSGAIADAIREIISSNHSWDTFSKNGIMNVRQHYTWQHHAEAYRAEAERLVSAGQASDMAAVVPRDAIGRRLVRLNHLIISDIDNTLLGGDPQDLKRLLELMAAHRRVIGFGVATGRTVDSAVQVLKAHNVPAPDVIISSVGSEIYYGQELQAGQGWETHIASGWDREKIVRLLKNFDFLEYQAEDTQRLYKVSYNMAPDKDRLAMIHDLLSRHKCRYNLIYSHQKYLDILPHRASKGKAIRYLSYKWEIPLGNFLVCGDSGNDEEMLRGEPLGVVVGNFSPELAKLRRMKHVFFAKGTYAAGILEAIAHYGFIAAARGRSHEPAE